MIKYVLPKGVEDSTLVGVGRTVGVAFGAILSWDALDVRERLVEEGPIPEGQVDEAIVEFRKFLMCVVIARATQAGSVSMLSPLVDEVWHAAILFTREYFALSAAILGEGQYLHHAPVVKSRPQTKASSDSFPKIYQEMFGEFPSIWGAKRRRNELIWWSGVQAVCFTDWVADCEEVCSADAPCTCNDGGSLPDASLVPVLELAS